MSWSGGTFSGQNGTSEHANRESNGDGITSAILDSDRNELVTGINTCLTKDGTNAATANLNLGGYKGTNAAAGSASTDLATVGQSLLKSGANAATGDLDMGAHKVTNSADGATLTSLSTVQQIQKSGLIFGGTSSGSANVQTFNLTPTPAAYTEGMIVGFTAGFANTSAVTINVNSLGPIALLGRNGAALIGGELIAGATYYAVYHAGSFQLLNPSDVGWKSWTPTISSASGSTGSTSTTGTYVQRADKSVSFDLIFSTTLTVASSATLTFTLPVTAANQNGVFIASTVDGVAFGIFISSVTVVSVALVAVANFPTGAKSVKISGTYQAA
jgi:hypothetical protein